MQLIVVGAALPSFLLMSSSRAYPWLRIAGLASLGWVVERLPNFHRSVDVVVNGAAHHTTWIAGGLFLISVVCWSLPKGVAEPFSKAGIATTPAP